MTKSINLYITKSDFFDARLSKAILYPTVKALKKNNKKWKKEGVIKLTVSAEWELKPR